jgi:hypothetical protein
MRAISPPPIRTPVRAQLPLPLPERAQAQRVEADEALRVAVVVGDRAFLEGREVLVVERVSLSHPTIDIALAQQIGRPAAVSRGSSLCAW